MRLCGPLPAVLCLAACAAATGADRSQAPDVASALRTLEAVGPMGKGNEAAARAWQQLVQSDASQLPAILAGLDRAGPLAANWLRAAVDAIAERQLRDTGALPVADLERFVLATEHSPRARRLAFEWLAQADATAPDRLIPSFLDDPSVEFRRDAVARLLDLAAGLEAAQKTDAARSVYQKALAAARDLDQVRTVAAELEKLGQKPDLAAHFGFLTRWKLIGPFDNSGESGFEVVYPPEQETDLAAQYAGKPREGAPQPVRWIDQVSQDDYGLVDLNQALGKANGVVGYALAEFEAAAAEEIELRLTSYNAAKIWLNGQLVHEHEVYHSGSQWDQYVARARLQPGTNLILLKLCQNEQTQEWAQNWAFQLRVCDAAGTAVLPQLPRAEREESKGRP